MEAATRGLAVEVSGVVYRYGERLALDRANVRAFEGAFRAAFPVKLPEEASRHKRFSFVLGSGGARLDLETFGGTISLRRPQMAVR